jgi:serine/threonine-protein kinase RsbW
MRSGAIMLAIESCLDHVYLVGAAVRGIAREAGLDEHRASQVELAVVEGVNNAIEHAYRNVPGRRVEVVVEVAERRLTIEIADCGVAMEWATECAAAAARAVADPLADGGRGLMIIRELMDEVDYRSDGGRNVLSLMTWITDGARS